MKRKMTLEFEVEVDDGERFSAVACELTLASGRMVRPVTFVLPRHQKVREGKHLRMDQYSGEVVRLGEMSADEKQGVE